jgi:hypothetical protein
VSQIAGSRSATLPQFRSTVPSDDRYRNVSEHQHVPNCPRVGADGTVCVYPSAAALVAALSAV